MSLPPLIMAAVYSCNTPHIHAFNTLHFFGPESLKRLALTLCYLSQHLVFAIYYQPSQGGLKRKTPFHLSRQN
jgi:hypothetical protein